MIPLNIPTLRQDTLRARLDTGKTLILTVLAAEFDVSIDTIRRDLATLEEEGLVKRVRGGAVPLARPIALIEQRIAQIPPVDSALIEAALTEISPHSTLIIDGGSTNIRLAALLPNGDDLMVITPSPFVAIESLKRGIKTLMIGGPLNRDGGVAVGGSAERAIANIAADLCFIGVCGLDITAGMSAYDHGEVGMKRAMMHAAKRSIALLRRDKIGKIVRHHVSPCTALSQLITDASRPDMQPFIDLDIDVHHV